MRRDVSWPLAASHTFSVPCNPSKLPLTIRRPSELNATLVTVLVCPFSVSDSCPVAARPTP